MRQHGLDLEETQPTMRRGSMVWILRRLNRGHVIAARPNRERVEPQWCGVALVMWPDLPWPGVRRGIAELMASGGISAVGQLPCL